MASLAYFLFVIHFQWRFYYAGAVSFTARKKPFLQNLNVTVEYVGYVGAL
jgi:hypothetical protein